MPVDSTLRTQSDTLDRELSGLDHLDAATSLPSRPSLAVRGWAALWPKLATIAVVLTLWQVVVWREWQPRYVLPSPGDVGTTLWGDLGTSQLWRAVANTMRRAVIGFGLAVVIGAVVGLAVSRWRALRAAIGSAVTGLQTMPSIAWFPFAILMFTISERAILFVVVLGAAPSIANGIIAGVDSVPPILRKAGITLGARGLVLSRDVIIPAAMPTVLTGLKQGWAFSWRSLMAGELLVFVPGAPSLGLRLHEARELSDADGLIATIVVIFVIGILIDAAVFGRIEHSVLSRRGLRTSA